MEETKVHYGIAKAHQMMQTVNNYIESADLTSLGYLLSWKESRSNIIPDPVISKSLFFSKKYTLVSVSFLTANSFSLEKFIQSLVILILLVIFILFIDYFGNIGCIFMLYCISNV